ncbi:glycosyltransferase family 2 protein, partial [Candidatus Peregrinibacteria bacterium]|nr:glycosyltransferase family 2 protein [Candidatus Peregrinibacteria bacterium]
MDAPILSVIIPTHKRAGTLRECLAHLERQTARDQIELIVVSDGHDPETASMLAPCHGERRRTTDTAHIGPSSPLGVTSWIKENAKFFEIEKSQQGVARNKGVQEARGEYVLFGQDDIFMAADV